MRFLKGFTAGLVVVGLAGCGAGASPALSVGSVQPSVGSVPPSAGSVPPSAGSVPPSAGSVPPRAVTSTAPPPSPVSPQMQTGARAAAAQFYELYSAGQFAAFWTLLSSATKSQVPKNTWVSVHEACPSAGAGKSRSIKAVTVFGTAAIVTEVITGASRGSTEDVFSYANGRWSYSLADLSVYGHGSVAADIAAAKAAGLCTGWKLF
jgi:hypothetical protein